VGGGTSRIGVGTFLVLRSILVFNAVLLIGVAALLAAFMEHPAGLVGAAICLTGAGMMIGGARWFDRLYERGR
jgi:hypothetical protein